MRSMFLRFSKGSVAAVFLQAAAKEGPTVERAGKRGVSRRGWRRRGQGASQRCRAHGPDEVKDGDAVADGADERVAVGREDDIALVVHGAAQVGELCAPLG